MKTGRITGLALRVGAMTVLALAIGAAPGAAQASDECRCVDRDGNPIERCSCFRAPSPERFRGFAWAGDARPRIGISVDAQQSARRDAQGAMVTDVMEGGPAEEAGIRRGDVITSIGGQSLFQPLPDDREEELDLDGSVPVQRLLAIAAELEPGEEVEIEYVRDGETATVTLEAEELSQSWGVGAAIPRLNRDGFRGWVRGRSDDAHVVPFRSEELDEELEELGDRLRDEMRVLSRDGDAPMVRFFGDGDGPGLVIDRYRGVGYGLELVALNPSLGSYFGADEGVLVADVTDDSTLGLLPGDVVTAIGDRPVTTPDRMRRILQSYGPDEEITLQVRRDGRDTSVTGRLGR